MSAKGWWLFATMAVLWGIPYLFISEAVTSFSPAAVVSARTLGGALILLPIALNRKALGPALRRWPWVLAFGAIEMGGPFFLLSDAERIIPSGLTGLLVSTVPLWAAVIGFTIGSHRAVSPVRVIGLLVGFGGVAVVVAGQGLAVTDAASTFVAVGEVLLTALLYAIAPFIVAAKLSDVPSIGPISLALVAIGVIYLPFALLTQHDVPQLRSVVALAALAVLCTAVAFVAFFALIAEVGPVTAPLFTYVNPVVAIALGVVILGEHLSPWLLLGFPLVLVGCWLAATGGRWRRAVPSPSEPDVPVEALPGAVVAPVDRPDESGHGDVTRSGPSPAGP